MNIDAQARAGHIIRVLHLSVAFFPPIACVSNYQSEPDFLGSGSVGGGGQSLQKSSCFHRQRVKETSIKMPQGSSSAAPRVCDSEPAPINPLWLSHCAYDIWHQMCFLCRLALRVVHSACSDSVDWMVESRHHCVR